MRTLVDRCRQLVRRSWHGSRTGTVLWASLAIGAGAILEVLARRSAGDLEDFVGVLALTGLAMLVAHGLPRRFPRCARALLATKTNALALLRGQRIQIGFDLRGTPPIPRRMPPQFLVPLAASIATCIVVGSTLSAWPGGARESLRSVSGLACLAALGLLWSVLVAASIVLVFFPFHWLDAILANSPVASARRSGIRRIASTLYVVLLSCCALFLPLEAAFALIALTLGLEAVDSLLPGQRSLVMLWKRTEGAEAVRSVSFGAVNLSVFSAAIGAITALALVTLGEALVGNPSPDTLGTRVLGTIFVWSSAGFCAAFVLPQMVHSLRIQLDDPARSQPPTVWVDGAPTNEREAIRDTLARSGLRARFAPEPRRPTDVPLRVTGTAVGDAFRMPIWPLELRPSDLTDPAVQRAIRRRDEILCRRTLMKGLAKAFKAATRRKYENGEGYWLAPHLWIQDRLVRDTEEDAHWIVGPPYRRILPRPARHHFHEVMKALEIDLIFVEDGVGFRRLKPVLGVLFERYDVDGPRRLDDERFFRGLHGVRVLFQEFTLEEPLVRTKYPEPDHDELARARILHVFRDRGDDDEEELAPTGSGRKPRTRDWTPVGGPA